MSISKKYGLAAASLALIVSAAAASPVSAANSNSDKNHETYWEKLGYGTCIKYDDLDVKTFTVPANNSGYVYTLAVVKAGTIHDEDTDVKAGDVLRHSAGKDISHVILCQDKVVEEDTPVPDDETPAPDNPEAGGQVLGDQKEQQKTVEQKGKSKVAEVAVLPAAGSSVVVSATGALSVAVAAYAAARRLLS